MTMTNKKNRRSGAAGNPSSSSAVVPASTCRTGDEHAMNGQLPPYPACLASLSSQVDMREICQAPSLHTGIGGCFLGMSFPSRKY